MREQEFNRFLRACLARDVSARSDAPQLDPGVRSTRALLEDVLTDAPGDAGDWILRAWRVAALTHARRAEQLALAVGWLEPTAVGDWGHRLIHEAVEHIDRDVRAAGLRALDRWRDPAAVAILRGPCLEADAVLSAALHEARDEHDPRSVPASHERAPLARQRRRAWEVRQRRRRGDGERTP
jgi:hypothetical protein